MLDQDFVNVFVDANKRLKQPLASESICSALEYLASQPINTCLSIQPGSSGYAWSERKVLIVFFWNKKDTIRIRFIKRVSVRNSEISPGSFKELRAFPNGKVMEKLNAWDNIKDGTQVSKKQLKAVKLLPKNFYNLESETEGDVFFHQWFVEGA